MTGPVTVAMRRRANRTMALAVASVLASLSFDARAAPNSDEDLVNAINGAMARDDFDEAARLLEGAYAQDPQPTYLYSLGEAWLAANNCPAAIDAFDRYLATNPPEIDANAARARRATCPVTVPEPEPLPPPRPLLIEQNPSQPAVPTPHKTLAQDPLFWGLTGAGTILALAGSGALVGTRISADNANRAVTEGRWEGGVSQTQTLATAGTVVFAVAGTLLLGAVARGITFRRTSRARD